MSMSLDQEPTDREIDPHLDLLDLTSSTSTFLVCMSWLRRLSRPRSPGCSVSPVPSNDDEVILGLFDSIVVFWTTDASVMRSVFQEWVRNRSTHFFEWEGSCSDSTLGSLLRGGKLLHSWRCRMNFDRSSLMSFLGSPISVCSISLRCMGLPRIRVSIHRWIGISLTSETQLVNSLYGWRILIENDSFSFFIEEDFGGIDLFQRVELIKQIESIQRL